MSLLGNALLGAIGGGAKSFADQIRLEAQQAREDRLRDEDQTLQKDRDEKSRQHDKDMEGIRAANNNATASLTQTLRDESAKKNQEMFEDVKDENGNIIGQRSKKTNQYTPFKTGKGGSDDLLKLKEHQVNLIDSKIGDFQSQLDDPELSPAKKAAIKESIAALRNDQRAIMNLEPLPFGAQEDETEKEEEPGILNRVANAAKDFFNPPNPVEVTGTKDTAMPAKGAENLELAKNREIARQLAAEQKQRRQSNLAKAESRLDDIRSGRANDDLSSIAESIKAELKSQNIHQRQYRYLDRAELARKYGISQQDAAIILERLAANL